MKQGWRTRRLGEACAFLNRGISPTYVDLGGIRILNQRCIRDHVVTFEPSRRHDSRARAVDRNRLIQRGDVLVNSTGTGTLGRVAQIREGLSEPTTVDSHVTIVRPIPGIFQPEFFGYMLVAIENDIQKAGEGCGGQTELARSTLAEGFSVSFPESIAEQQRIVAALDDAFATVAVAKVNTGKNLQNIYSLFERALEEVFDAPAWTEKPLATLASFRNGINYTKNSKGQQVRIVGVKDFQRNFWVPKDDLESVTLDGALSEIDELRPGDILAVRSNGNPELIGRCILANGIPANIAHSGFTIRIRLAGNEVTPEYLCHFMKRSESRARLVASGTGTNIKSLNQQTLAALPIRFPSIREQENLTRKIEAISKQVQRAEGIYRAKLAALDELKKSILTGALAGEL